MGSGVEALEVLMAVDDDTALVLCDHVMPEMDGSALVAALEARGIDTPVIMVTGYALGSALDAATSGIVAGWIRKPVGLAELSDALRDALER